MLHFKLGPKRAVLPEENDELGRAWIGYERGLSEQTIYEQNRGRWRLGPRAAQERYAMFSDITAGLGRAVIEISGIEKLPTKSAVVGTVLPPATPCTMPWLAAGLPTTSATRSPTPPTRARTSPPPAPVAVVNRSFRRGNSPLVTTSGQCTRVSLPTGGRRWASSPGTTTNTALRLPDPHDVLQRTCRPRRPSLHGSTNPAAWCALIGVVGV